MTRHEQRVGLKPAVATFAQNVKDGLIALAVTLLVTAFFFGITCILPACLSEHADPKPGQSKSWQGPKMKARTK